MNCGAWNVNHEEFCKPPPDKTLEELVPCPCCDAPAELDRMRGFRALHDGHIGNAVAIYCTKCGLEISLCHEDYPEYDIEGLVKTIVGLWNVRVIPKPTCEALQSATASQQREVRDLKVMLDDRNNRFGIVLNLLNIALYELEHDTNTRAEVAIKIRNMLSSTPPSGQSNSTEEKLSTNLFPTRDGSHLRKWKGQI